MMMGKGLVAIGRDLIGIAFDVNGTFARAFRRGMVFLGVQGRRRHQARRKQTQEQEPSTTEHRCRDSGSRATCHGKASGGVGPALPRICLTELIATLALRICVRPHPCTLKLLQGQAIGST
jgi:hypothetical protein